MNRVNLYIDGFNFYYGIKRRATKSANIHVGHSWCDFKKLGENCLLPFLPGNSKLNKIKYFTSSVANFELSKHERSRQKCWLQFLTDTIPEIIIIEGYHIKENDCARKEKLTDVNIAVNMLIDCFHHEYDTAILISADFDLFPAIKAIREEFSRDIWVWVPPESSFANWKREAGEYGYKCEELTPTMLANSRLPYSMKLDGAKICLPKGLKWHLPKEYQ